MSPGSRVLRALSRSCAARSEQHRARWQALAERIARRIADPQQTIGRRFAA